MTTIIPRDMWIRIASDPISQLKSALNKLPRKYDIYLSKEDSDLLEKKCKLMPITPEQYIANLVSFDVRPADKGFRIITKHGALIDSGGLSINEYMDKTLKEML